MITLKQPYQGDKINVGINERAATHVTLASNNPPQSFVHFGPDSNRVLVCGTVEEVTKQLDIAQNRI